MSKTFSITQALAIPSNVALLRRHNVIYVDRGLIAINKPSGLVTQGTLDAAKKEGTIQVAIDDIQTALNMKEGPYTVHRLDKQTTGLYMLATTQTQAKTLSKAFAPSTELTKPPLKASKKYLALVHTHSPKAKEIFGGTRSSDPQVGTKRRIDLDLYINREGLVSLWANVVNRLGHADLESALKRKRMAVSEVEVLGISPKYPIALVGLQLFTGVKHQLRVTLASFCKAPILGDSYGDATDKSSLPLDLLPPEKLMLHSNTLALERFQPKPFTFQACAPPPKEFIDVCQRVGISLPEAVEKGSVLYNGKDMTERLRWKQDAGLEEDGHEFQGLEGAWIAN